MNASKEMTAHRKRQTLPAREERRREGLVFTPPVDIFRTDRDIVMIADMPGVPPDGIRIDLHNGILTMTAGMRPWEGAEESDVRVEFEIGTYVRRFAVPAGIDADRIDARYSDGTLRLRLPMSEESRPQQIAVKSG
jgi:HSP20 family molecular chaperone IbpA